MIRLVERENVVYRFSTSPDNPAKTFGHTLWAENYRGLEMYGEYLWQLDVSNTPHIDTLVPTLRTMLQKDYYRGKLPLDVEETITLLAQNKQVRDHMEEEEAIEDAIEELAWDFSPPDIVDSGAAWDYPALVEWAYERVFLPQGVSIVRTDDGAVAFTSDVPPERIQFLGYS